MQFSVAFLVVLIAAGYDFAVAGGFGALTGLVVSLTIATGLLQILGLGAGPRPTTAVEAAIQRFQGALWVSLAAWAFSHGGWHRGWLWGLGAAAVPFALLGPLHLAVVVERKLKGRGRRAPVVDRGPQQFRVDTNVEEIKQQARAALDSDRAARQARDVVGKYRDALERWGARGQADPAERWLSPLSELPASKEEIKDAIKVLLPTIPKEDVRQFKNGYVDLACFVPDADAKFAAEHSRRIGAHTSTAPAAVGRDKFIELLKQKDAEQMLLLTEIGAFAREHELEQSSESATEQPVEAEPAPDAGESERVIVQTGAQHAAATSRRFGVKPEWFGPPGSRRWKARSAVFFAAFFALVFAFFFALGSLWVVFGFATWQDYLAVSKACGALALVSAIVGGFVGGYYQGSARLLSSPRWGSRKALVVVVGLPWLFFLWFFGRGTALSHYSLSGTEALGYAVFATFMGFMSYASTRATNPRPRSRAYLIATFAIVGLCLWGSSRGSSSDEYNDWPDDAESPAHQRTRALFNFLLYTGACFVGIASAGNKPAGETDRVRAPGKQD